MDSGSGELEHMVGYDPSSLSLCLHHYDNGVLGELNRYYRFAKLCSLNICTKQIGLSFAVSCT